MANPGLILLDAVMRPVFANPEALHILAYPGNPREVHTMDDLICQRLRSLLTPEDLAANDGRIREYRSGRRKYVCRIFLLAGREAEVHRAHSVVIMFERSPRGTFDFPAIAQRYSLTPREARTAQLLMYGLTSKEIAVHLGISPNTVKAFLKVIMLKMEVTTRTGIVGRILESQLEMAKVLSQTGVA